MDGLNQSVLFPLPCFSITLANILQAAHRKSPLSLQIPVLGICPISMICSVKDTEFARCDLNRPVFLTFFNTLKDLKIDLSSSVPTTFS